MVTPRSPTPPDDVHGGIDAAELERLGMSPDRVLDFSANLNPFGPSPTVGAALRDVPIDRYPDRSCRRLRQALARHLDVGEESILVGNGSAELIWLAAIAFLSPGDKVAVLGPAFGEYQRAARRMGAAVTVYRASPEEGFRPPLGAFAEGLVQEQPNLAILASPNNPTGQLVSLADVFTLAERHPRTLFVLDEAYADFVARPRLGRKPPANVIRLRSLTKAHGLAGLRLGYALGAAEILDALRAVQPPWSVNAFAQAAGVTALEDVGHLHDCLVRLESAKAQLIEQLQAAGFAPVPSAVPFFLVPVGDAARCRLALLRRGVLVRDCTSFGLSEYIRVSTRSPEENARLVAALVEAQPCR